MFNFVQQVLTEIKKFLGHEGLANYCDICGKKKVFVKYKGFYLDEVYECPDVSKHGTNKPGIGGNCCYA